MLTVQITMEGGVIQDMQCPAGVRVVVHDYDVDSSEEDLRRTPTGTSTSRAPGARWKAPA